MSKYTPGPWKIDGDSCGCNFISANEFLVLHGIKTGLTKIVAQTVKQKYYDNSMSAVEERANARLIAAAPEMKDRLKEAKECLIYLTPWWEDDLERIEGVIDSINALLRRIEGEEEAK